MESLKRSLGITVNRETDAVSSSSNIRPENNVREDPDDESSSKMKSKLLSMWNNVKYGRTMFSLNTSGSAHFSSQSPVWILGLFYHRKVPPQLSDYINSMHEKDVALEAFMTDFSSRLWLTYRREFEEFEGTTMNTDCGWGCMIRSGQMLIGNALILLHLGRHWRWKDSNDSKSISVHRSLVRLFGDSPCEMVSPLSIHRLVSIANLILDKQPGDWFGPAATAHILKAALELPTSQKPDKSVKELLGTFRIYVSHDTTVYKQDVLDLCLRKKSSKESSPSKDVDQGIEAFSVLDQDDDSIEAIAMDESFVTDSKVPYLFDNSEQGFVKLTNDCMYPVIEEEFSMVIDGQNTRKFSEEFSIVNGRQHPKKVSEEFLIVNGSENPRKVSDEFSIINGRQNPRKVKTHSSGNSFVNVESDFERVSADRFKRQSSVENGFVKLSKEPFENTSRMSESFVKIEPGEGLPTSRSSKTNSSFKLGETYQKYSSSTNTRDSYVASQVVERVSTNGKHVEKQSEKLYPSLSSMNYRMSHENVDPVEWVPVLILVPVRLGTTKLNPLYGPCVQALLADPTCVGIIGGRPKHSLYFLGFQDDNLIHLDPHLVQDKVDVFRENFGLDSFHCSTPRKMSLTKMDPSCCFGFLLTSRAQFEAWCELTKHLVLPPTENGQHQVYPMFSIVEGSSRDVEKMSTKNFLMENSVYDENENGEMESIGTEDFVFV